MHRNVGGDGGDDDDGDGDGPGESVVLPLPLQRPNRARTILKDLTKHNQHYRKNCQLHRI